MEHDLTKGPVTKTLFRFVIPFLISTIVQYMYTLADMIVIGRFADAPALAAVNTSGQLMLILTSFIVGIAAGGTVLTGQYFGAGEKGHIRQTISGIFYVFLFAAVVLTTVLLLFADGLITITRVPEASFSDAVSYLRICACGILFISGYNAVSGILRGIGDSRNPMVFVMISCLFNIAGDLVLVGAFGMGVIGAAIATVAAQLLAFILSVITLQKSSFRLSGDSFRFLSDHFFRVLRTGIPLGLQEALPLVSFLLITVIINNMGFVERSAGVGVVERVIGFGQMCPLAFIPALSAFTAQNVGAKEIGRTIKGLRVSILLCLIATIVIWLPVFLFPDRVVSIFSADPNVIKYGADYLRSYSLDIPLVSFVFCLNAFFAGYGKTSFTMLNVVLSTFFIRVPIVFFVSRIPDVSFILIGCAAPVTSVVQILVQLIFYKKGSWRKGV